jgi:aspartate aminotransferase, cytoplasmic
MSSSAGLPTAQPDAAFALVEAYKADPSPHKVDLSPGFYRDEDAKPWILPSVRKVSLDSAICQQSPHPPTCVNTIQAKEALQREPTENHEHLPILGHTGLLNSAVQLVFDATAEDTASIASIQTIAGTGANHLGALLLSRIGLAQTVWISNLSWINHHEIWTLVDRTINRQVYPYFDEASFTIGFERTVSTLKEKTKEGDIVVLHGCGHNPTGVDFTKDQWKTLSVIFEEKKLFAFFDLA